VLVGCVPSLQVVHPQRHEQRGARELRIAELDRRVVHETELQDVPGECQGDHGDFPALKGSLVREAAGGESNRTHPSVAPEESVGQREGEVEVDRLEDRHPHLQQLVTLVGAVADEQEVVDEWRCPLLRGGKIVVSSGQFQDRPESTRESPPPLSQLTSYLQAISRAAAPSNCNESFVTRSFPRYVSTIFTAR
jgi:hypothetical protein